MSASVVAVEKHLPLVGDESLDAFKKVLMAIVRFWGHGQLQIPSAMLDQVGPEHMLVVGFDKATQTLVLKVQPTDKG
jgi:hypothetical protein